MMKKLWTAMLALCLALMAVPCAAATPKTGAADAVLTAAADKTLDDRDYDGFCGRLTVSAVGIDVALYNSYAQSVCDRADSACCFAAPGYAGRIIADHSNQDFSVLTQITVGTTAEITDAEGDVTQLRCVQVLNGHNTGSTLTDDAYRNVMGCYDYLTYTCLNGWRNVRICQWEIVPPA